MRLCVFLQTLLILLVVGCEAGSVHRRSVDHRSIHAHAKRVAASSSVATTTTTPAVTSIQRVRRKRCPAPVKIIPIGVDVGAVAPLNGAKGEAASTSVAAESLPASAISSRASASASASAPASAASGPSSKSPASSPAPAPAPDAPRTSRIDQLFPIKGFSKSWSTCPQAASPRELNDGTLRPGSVLRSTPHSYTNAPDGRWAMKAYFPQGSYTFKNYPQGGFSFYAPGPADVDLTTAKEATFGYSVFFPAGFAFNMGGKLPGLYGGNSDAEATGCSGGRRDTSCFSVRLMWRTNGDGEFYTYLPPGYPANDKLCGVAPFSECNPTYGASVGRGVFRFATGAWTVVSERVRLNDPGQSNGEIQLFVNGKSVLDIRGLVLRDSGAGKIRGIQAQTFFGGSKPEWASPKNQDIYFSDFSVAITKTF